VENIPLRDYKLLRERERERERKREKERYIERDKRQLSKFLL